MRGSVDHALLAQPAITILQGVSLINRHFLSHSFHGSGVQAQWIPLLKVHQAAANMPVWVAISPEAHNPLLGSPPAELHSIAEQD